MADVEDSAISVVYHFEGGAYRLSFVGTSGNCALFLASTVLSKAAAGYHGNDRAILVSMTGNGEDARAAAVAAPAPAASGAGLQFAGWLP